MKNICCLITHSIGEVDVLLPVFNKLNQNYKVKIIFTVKKIYNDYNKNTLFKYFVKQKSIEVFFIQSSNKFDFPVNSRTLIIKIFLKFIKLKFFFQVFYQIYISKILFHEITNQIDSTFVLYFFKKFFNKKIFVYNHAIGSKNKNKNVNTVKQFAYAHYLSFQKDELEFSKNKGFKSYFYIGNPKLDPSWVNFLKNFIIKIENKLPDHILILLQNSNNFENKAVFNELLINISLIIQKYYPNINIFFKPHPRDNLINIKNIINKYSNLKLYENDIISAISKSIFVVSLHTSAVIDVYLLNKLVIEICLPNNKWKIKTLNRPLYNQYVDFSFDNFNDFENNIKNIKYKKVTKKNIIQNNNFNLKFLNVKY
jgi:hypothetical protein